MNHYNFPPINGSFNPYYSTAETQQGVNLDYEEVFFPDSPVSDQTPTSDCLLPKNEEQQDSDLKVGGLKRKIGGLKEGKTSQKTSETPKRKVIKYNWKAVEEKTQSLQEVANQYLQTSPMSRKEAPLAPNQEALKAETNKEGNEEEVEKILEHCTTVFATGLEQMRLLQEEKDAKIRQLEEQLSKEIAGRRALTKYIMEHKTECLGTLKDLQDEFNLSFLTSHQ